MKAKYFLAAIAFLFLIGNVFAQGFVSDAEMELFGLLSIPPLKLFDYPHNQDGHLKLYPLLLQFQHSRFAFYLFEFDCSLFKNLLTKYLQKDMGSPCL